MNSGAIIGALFVIVTAMQFFGIGERAGRKYKEYTKPISGSWYFRKGDEDSWKNADYNHGSWEKIDVPGAWEDKGHPGYDGIAWYRYEVVIPKKWKRAQGLIIELGKIDDEDNTYFNGTMIGTNNIWEKIRVYGVSKSLVKFGEKNIIAVRVNDTGGGGGMVEGDIRIKTGVVRKFDISDY